MKFFYLFKGLETICKKFFISVCRFKFKFHSIRNCKNYLELNYKFNTWLDSLYIIQLITA